jgi:3-hydroxy acid dehydrogenase/malonic semialdehyde reductase
VSSVVVPHLKGKRQGDLIFMGSESALSGARQGSLYCAAKFALRGLSQSLRAECGRRGVRVSLINPGMVRTPFFDQLNFRPGVGAEHAIEPDDVAQAVSMVLTARQGTVIDEINLSPQSQVLDFD